MDKGLLKERKITADAGEHTLYLDKLESLARICESASWSVTYEDIYQRMALALATNLECDYANIYLLDVDGDVMTTYASHSQQENYSTNDKTAVTSKTTLVGRLQRMIENKEPIMMDYYNPHPCDQIPDSAVASGFSAAITVPLVAAGEVLGIYNLCYRQQKRWSEGELSYLKAIGRLLGVNIHRAQMSRKVVEMQILNERKFLSSEIHDNLAQSVSSMKIGSETALMFLDRGDMVALRENLERLEVIGLQAVKLLREEMLSLRVAQSETRGLLPSIKETLERYQDKWGVNTQLIIDQHSEPGVTIQAELQMMRILHECLSNVLRHASATEVEVELEQVERTLYVQIRDNGKGFDIAKVPSERLGIRIMKERTESVGGTFALESELGKGTCVKLVMPSIS